MSNRVMFSDSQGAKSSTKRVKCEEAFFNSKFIKKEKIFLSTGCSGDGLNKFIY